MVEEGARVAESEPNSHLAAHGDGEVERLLREAESLTQEVARETGTPARDADALLSGEFAAAPDPLAAVDATASSIMSLEDLLGELGPGESAGGPQASTGGYPPGPPNASKSVSPRSSQDTRLLKEPSRSHSIDIPAPRSGPRDEHIPSEEVVHTQQYEPPGEHASGGTKEPQESTEKTDPPKAQRVPIGPRILQLGKSGARGVLTVVLLIVRDAPIGVLSFVDLPFRRTPRSIKNAIGIFGAITLGMGALAWALPGLMRPKPTPPAVAESEAEVTKAEDSGHSGGH